MLPRVVAVYGPTASGKSGLALSLARRWGGEIINADSRQVYRGVQVVTAGPSREERAVVPHHLFDFMDVRETYSAGRWAADCARVIGAVTGRGNLPIVVGGTGFYLKTLMAGMGGVPAVPAHVTRATGEMAREELWAELQAADPVLAQRIWAKGEVMNRQRLARAVAVYRHTGVPLSAWQQEPGIPGFAAAWEKTGLNPPVEVLAARIAARWEQLVSAGVVEEIAALKAAGVPLEAPGLQGLGVAGFWDYIDGKMTLDAAVAQVVRRDLQYAKRQRTWLRTQFGAARVFESGEAALAALD